MPLTREIAHNTIIQIIGRLLSTVISLITLSLITRHLGIEDFGYYTTVFAYLQIFGILIDFGLQMSTANLISDPRYDESKMLNNIISLRFFSSLIFLGLASFLAFLFPYTYEVKLGISVTSLTFLFVSLTSVLIGLFQKHLKMIYVIYADLLGRILLLIFTIIMILYHYRLLGILTVTAVSSFITFFATWYYAQKYTLIRLEIDTTLYKKIFKTTWPIAITIALNLIYFKADTIILSLVRPQAEVGLYGASYKILEFLINFIYLFLGLLFPLMTKLYATKDIKGLKNLIQQGWDIIMMISIPMVLGTLIIGRPLMALVAGSEFIVSGDILKILILATVTIFLASLYGYVLVVLKLQKKLIKYYFINAALSLIFYFIFIPKYTFWAAAWITVGTEVFILMITSYLVFKHLQFIPHVKSFFQALTASMVMCIPLLFFSGTLPTLLVLCLGVIIYCLALYMVGGISKETLVRIFSFKSV